MILLLFYIRALDLVAHEKGIPKEEAARNRKQCCDPGLGPSLSLPTVSSSAGEFDEYNKEALTLFSEHCKSCLYCRTRNHEAIENALRAKRLMEEKVHADEEAKRRMEADEEERHRAEEAQLAQLEQLRLQRALEEEEAHRKAEEAEKAHRLAEEEAKRKHDDEVAAIEKAARLRAEKAAIKAAEEARIEQIEINLRILKEKKKKELEESENEKQRHEIEKAHAREELRIKARNDSAHHVENITEENFSEEDKKMMQILREEEAERRRLAENAARERRRASLGRRKFLRKHDGVLASSQSGLVYQDKVDDMKAKDDIAHMSLAHAKRNHLIHPHHTLGGKTFHASHPHCNEDHD